MTNNFEAMKELINYMYDTIQYAEINTKSDYCQECGFDGEILLDENGEWYCPNCGNRNHKTLNVCRRTRSVNVLFIQITVYTKVNSSTK